MTEEDKKKLYDDLAQEAKTIKGQLKEIASENPINKGDFSVRVEDLGDSVEDVAEEMASLDQRQAMVSVLKKRYKDVIHSMEKIKSGSYGKCENCSVDIMEARLKAMPVASLCIKCAKMAR